MTSLIAMRHNHETLERPSPIRLDGGCHLDCRLAGTDDDRAAPSAGGKIGSNRAHRIGRIDRRIEEAAQDCAGIANSS